MVAAGAVKAKLEKTGGVEGTVRNGRRKFIYHVPSAVAPEVAMAADFELRNVRARVRELERSVSRLTAQIDRGQPIEAALQRMTTAGSAGDKRAVAMA